MRPDVNLGSGRRKNVILPMVIDASAMYNCPVGQALDGVE